MGMIETEIKKILSSLILSFTQIESFRKFFYSKTFKGELCQIFSEIIKNNSIEKIEEYAETIKNKFELKEKDFKEANIGEKIINFFLKELKDEFVKEDPKYEKFIEELFYGKFKLINSHSKREENVQIPLIFNFDLKEFKSKESLIEEENEKEKINYICLDKLIQNQTEKQILKNFPRYDKFKAINMPEICFIYNINFKDNLLKYYRQIEIDEIPYELKYFLRRFDDKIEEYFKVNYLWYKLTSKEKKVEIIDDIVTIKGTPQFIIYQKNIKCIQNIFAKKDIFENETNFVRDLMNKHLIPEHSYENYYLLNKDHVMELSSKLNDKNNPEEINYREVKNILLKKNLLNVELDKKENMFEIPKNFIIVREKAYLNFLDETKDNYKINMNCDKYQTINFMAEINQNRYQIKFGENYAFMKIKTTKQDNIFICEYDKDKKNFKVIALINYIEELFNKEAEKYISNRGGLEFFYLKNKLNFEKDNKQKIIDENGNEIGFLINIEEMSNHLNIYKYEQIKPKIYENKSFLVDALKIDMQAFNKGKNYQNSVDNSLNNNNQSKQIITNSIKSDSSSGFQNPIFKLKFE